MATDRVQAAVCNHMGRVRRNNEDNFYLAGQYMPLDRMDAGGLFTHEGTGTQVFAVCDGMGGGEAGEEASCMVSEALDRAVRAGGIHTTQELFDLMQNTSNAIHRRHSALTGSTIAMLMLDHGHVIIMNIGDSRIYRLRNGRFKKISRDHVGVQAHSITQYLGMPEDDPLEPHLRKDDIGEWTIGTDTDTVYLLCSDGLTDMVPDKDIREVLMAQREPKVAAQMLTKMALERGGKDNTTVMVLRVPQDLITTSRSKGKLIGFILGLVAVSIPLIYVLIELIVRAIGG